MKSSRVLLLLVVVVVLLGSITFLQAAPGGPDSTTIQACVKKDGKIRLLGEQFKGKHNTECKKEEILIEFASSQGVALLGSEVGILGDQVSNLGSQVSDLEDRLSNLETLLTPTPTPTPTILDILGPTGVILPLADFDAGGFDSATFTTQGAIQAVFTWSEPPNSFDTLPSFQGSVPVVTFNGIDEEADTPDVDHWSRGDGASDSPFSIGVWVNVRDATNSEILAKWNETTPSREWLFWMDGSDLLTIRLYDESADTYIGLSTATAISEGIWTLLVVTYDGSGAEGGLTIYQDEVAASTNSNSFGAYTAMENQDAQVQLGAFEDTNLLFDGKMAGGPLGPFFTHTELTADEVVQLYDLGRAALEPP